MPSPPKMHGQPVIRRDDETHSFFLEACVQGADVAETKWYLDEVEISEASGDYKMNAIPAEDGQLVLFQCEIKNCSIQGTFKAIFANNEGIFKVKFGKIGELGVLCRHTDTNFEPCRLYTKTNFDRDDFTHDHRFCMHEH